MKSFIQRELFDCRGPLSVGTAPSAFLFPISSEIEVLDNLARLLTALGCRRFLWAAGRACQRLQKRRPGRGGYLGVNSMEAGRPSVIPVATLFGHASHTWLETIIAASSPHRCLLSYQSPNQETIFRPFHPPFAFSHSLSKQISAHITYGCGGHQHILCQILFCSCSLHLWETLTCYKFVAAAESGDD